MQELTIDEEFYFQWHLTERCNRACRHCYQDGSPTSELGLNDLLTIVDLMEEAVNKWETKGTLSLTGGEPFLRKDDLHALMYRIDRSDALAYYDILTNGSLITRDKRWPWPGTPNYEESRFPWKEQRQRRMTSCAAQEALRLP